jgi:hypothetical protein
VRRHCRHIEAAEVDTSLGRRGIASDQIEQGRFASAVGSNHGQCFAGGDGYTDAVYGFERTVMLGYRLKLEKGCHEGLLAAAAAVWCGGRSWFLLRLYASPLTRQE